tara:strand:+ start:625 stop:966 length:342 start_codon:yes stop_codon:yes gene_type:complete
MANLKRQVKSDFRNFASALGRVVTGNKDPDPRGTATQNFKDTERNQRARDANKASLNRNERSNNMRAGSSAGGQTAAEAKAAKLARERAAGQKRRKAFEKAKTTLIFNKGKKA